MKFLTTFILSSLLCPATWADTVKITIERKNTNRTVSTAPMYYPVEVGQSRVFNTMRKRSFTPTEGDCSGVDTSKLAREAQEGELLEVRTSTLVNDQVMVSLNYEQQKFLGTTSVPFNLLCKVNNPSGEAFSFGASAPLRKGAPPLLLSANAEMNVYGVIEP